MDDPIIKIALILFGSLVGFMIGIGKDIWMNRKKKFANFQAILSEAKFCSQMAHIYKRDELMLPLFRLPTKAYEVSLAQLLATSSVKNTELWAIQTFYMSVESLNKGLDDSYNARGNKKQLEAAHLRNLENAELLMPSGDPRNSHFHGLNNMLSKYG